MPTMDRSEFTPAYRENHTLKMHQGGNLTNIKITGVRPLGSHRHDWGQLATAGTAELAKQCTHLQVADGEIAQYRYIIRDVFEIELKHPSATLYYAARSPSNTVGENWRIRPWAQDDKVASEEAVALWIASEFWVYQDTDPRFDVYPILSQVLPLPQMHIEFFGFKYAWEAIGQEGQVDLWIDRFAGE